MRDPSLPSSRFGPTQPGFMTTVGASVDLPFSPRDLTRQEQRREDLYLYHSPKLARTVAVIGVLALALALELEFSAHTVGFVERPRVLPYRDREVELNFWHREQSGRERFYLLVPNSTLEVERQSRQRRHRDGRDIIQAANAAGISLQFVFEADVLAKAASIGTWFRLLPYVQTALTLPHRHSIQGRVLEAFAAQSRMTMDQIEAGLVGLNAADVRAVVCAHIHSGTLAIDPTKPLSRHTVVELGWNA